MAKSSSGTHFGSYEDVYRRLSSEKDRRLNLLLGNGFSMSYNPKIFSYNALQSRINDEDDKDLRILFDTLKTNNFEEVMNNLDLFIKLSKKLGADAKFIDRIEHANVALQTALIQIIEDIHPEHVFKLQKSEVANCLELIKPFLDEKNGGVFSTNYDLLLYWVLMRGSEMSEDLICRDGFGRDRVDDGDQYTPVVDREYSELVWGKNSDTQNVFYLHGALHLFDNEVEIIKEEYDGEFILEKIRRRIKNKQYPIFVAAGNGEEKLKHIIHNPYLEDAYKNFRKMTGSLVTIGFGFGDSDKHIIKAIREAANQGKHSQLRSVYVGVFSEDDKKHIEDIKDEFGCKVNTFDSSKMNIWR